MGAPRLNPEEVLCEIDRLFAERGGREYFGEPVSQLEHALQSAWLAESAQASDALVIAALLHDIGHLLHGLPEDIAAAGVDGHHEAVGRRWLARIFPDEVTQPILLHVAAKRYLCATEPAYFAALSSASQASLMLQGGPMDAAEQARFAALPGAEAALCLRRWDDAAKIAGLEVPPLKHYHDRLRRLLSEGPTHVDMG